MVPYGISSMFDKKTLILKNPLLLIPFFLPKYQARTGPFLSRFLSRWKGGGTGEL